jgi:hypothetical protein
VLDDGRVDELLRDGGQQLASDLRMYDLATAEEDGQSHRLALLQEFTEASELDVVVVTLDARPEPQLLQ